jgi:DNA-binding transcriptional MerR regulator/methylmalonyl-CoA mutase cobalamin-binding subunit
MTEHLRSARYPIRAVSNLTGIKIDTLRAWERRHGVVTPVRDGRGRMYTDTDIERLRLLRGALDRGHSIGRLARLDNAELRKLSAGPDASAQLLQAPVPDAGTLPPIDISVLDVALRTFDTIGLDQEISRLAGVLRPLDFLQSALIPLLLRVHQGRSRIAQEHLISAFVRNMLGALLRLSARPNPPARLLFATLSGDRHEIGTLGAAMLAANSGLGVTYLGTDVPARDIVKTASLANVQVVVLGVTPSSTGETLEHSLETVVRQLESKVELWVGGPGAECCKSIIPPRGMVFHDYASYQQELVRIGGRVP